MKIFFLPDINKSVEENVREGLKQRTAAMCFNECNNMQFHDLPRNKVATATHNLTSLLGLDPKFSHRLIEFRLEIRN